MTQMARVTGISFDKSTQWHHSPSKKFLELITHGSTYDTLDGEESKGGNLIAKNSGSMFFVCGGGCLFCEHVHGEIASALELRLDVTQFDIISAGDTYEYGNRHGVWQACC